MLCDMQCEVYEVMYYGTISIVLRDAKSESTPTLNTTVRALVGFASKKNKNGASAALQGLNKN